MGFMNPKELYLLIYISSFLTGSAAVTVNKGNSGRREREREKERERYRGRGDLLAGWNIRGTDASRTGAPLIGPCGTDLD